MWNKKVVAGLLVAGALVAAPVFATDIPLTMYNLDSQGLAEDESDGYCNDDPLATDYWRDPITDNWMDGLTDVGDLTNCVFKITRSAQEVYVYVHRVYLDGISNVSEFNTGFFVQGFDKDFHRVGYSFSESDAADALGSGPITAAWDDDPIDGTIDWEIKNIDEKYFDSGEYITFFFESEYGPRCCSRYNIIDTTTAKSFSYAPSAPEPSLLLLMGSGLLGLGVVRSRRRS